MKIKFTITAIVLLLNVLAYGQDWKTTNSPHKVRTVIKGNPFSILAGVIPLTSEYRLITEYAVSKNQSIQLGLSYLGKSPFLSLIEASTPNNNAFNQKFIVRGYRIQTSHKYYFSQLGDKFNRSDFLAPQGFYLSPHVSFSSAKIYNQYLQVYDAWMRVTQFNASLLFGGQLFLGSIAIDLFTGLGYKKNEWSLRESPTQIIIIDPDDLDLPPSYGGSIKFSLGFNIGYGF
ncbi:MAG: hypothetical protein JKY42_05975 [Flavobacteriales bacterium]|nr:hypothetical protein [Flavobacteriales bacterium]